MKPVRYGPATDAPNRAQRWVLVDAHPVVMTAVLSMLGSVVLMVLSLVAFGRDRLWAALISTAVASVAGWIGGLVALSLMKQSRGDVLVAYLPGMRRRTAADGAGAEDGGRSGAFATPNEALTKLGSVRVVDAESAGLAIPIVLAVVVGFGNLWWWGSVVDGGTARSGLVFGVIAAVCLWSGARAVLRTRDRRG